MIRTIEKTIVLPPINDKAIIFKNLTDNAKNIAANAKIEDMGRLFKTHMSSKQDVKSTLTSVIEVEKFVLISITTILTCTIFFRLRKILLQVKRLCWTFVLTPSNNISMPVVMDSRKRTSRNLPSFKACATLLAFTLNRPTIWSQPSTQLKLLTCPRRAFKTHRHRKVCIGFKWFWVFQFCAMNSYPQANLNFVNIVDL